MRNRLTQDSPTLFVDQYGQMVVASSAKELLVKVNGTKAIKQYIDKKSGGSVWNGYVVGHRWFTAFKWQEIP